VEKLLGPDPRVPFAPRLFAAAGREHSERHGTKAETFAKVSVKARRHAANNPLAVFREPLTLEQVLDSPVVAAPLTRFQCCPMTCGAAAVVLSSGPRGRRSVEILGLAVRTDGAAAFDGSAMELAGRGMTEAAARAAYEEAGLGPDEVDVVELHDCFTTNEVIGYEALGLCGQGEAERLIEDGDNTYGGRVVVNPSGGLLARGHPLGATGVAQCVELVQQLRGEAGPRQVERARIGLQQNIGLGGAAVVTVYGGGS
jgi:acetyl-CoA acyltransferase